MSALACYLATWWRRASQTQAQGQGLVEYGLMLVLIAIVATVSLVFIGGNVSATLSNIGASV